VSIAQNIKRRRLELKMSQQDLADALGYKSRSTIAKIEAEDNNIPHSKLKDFARVLDTTLDYIVKGEEKHFSVSNEDTNEYIENHNNKNVAIILAGGKSTRNLQNIPNQFINVYGKPVIIYCMEAYQRHPVIDEIYAICLKGWEDVLHAYAKEFNITKLKGIITGGNSGIESIKIAVRNIIQSHSDGDCIFLQESTRPFINEEMISNAWTCYKQNGSAIASSLMTDYVQFIETDDGSLDYLDREKVYSIQSPEVYNLRNLLDAISDAEINKMPLNHTCCAMLMYDLKRNLHFYMSSTANIKIVRQEDLAIFKALLKQEQ
jgi:2-C-methyl-D-erythritol 4-phosphate cytidylyltransferase